MTAVPQPLPRPTPPDASRTASADELRGRSGRSWWRGWGRKGSVAGGAPSGGLSGAIDPSGPSDPGNEADPQWVAHRNYLQRLRESGL